MVWHAFLLNPRDFEWYCITHRLERICKVPFPWLHIVCFSPSIPQQTYLIVETQHKVINSRDYTYKLSKSHQSILRDMHLEPDLFDALTEVGKRDSHASNIFSQYGTGKRKAATSNYRGNILSHSEIVFAKTVETAISQAGENKPLVDNVIRQAAFVNKMHSHLWIRSPAVEGTVRRAIGRYEKFLQLFQDYPHATLVPTLDIDLIWHTHLCDPEQYRACFLQKVGRVVDHDDKIGKPILDKSFVQMQEMFNVRFGQSYDICLCWDCEAILSAVETLDGIGDMNSIDDLETGVDSAMDNVENDLRYYRAVEIARRKGIGLPICET
ncbi:hypothetical protein BDV25DRAFT_150934 [Aspergillus avenaceus]|uniref:Uncharacterized protein n=1 Tax=Aspergillus avenaceus TaxID=36643 RepID=A0A5N6U1D2_ASPAV|nr:hypothetical protein BDV25DRAFT_150934 [Aspergillus avenaceus]